MQTTTLKLNSLLKKTELTSKTKKDVLEFNSVLVVNTILLIVSALLIAYYIIGANSITSDNYKIKLFNDRLMQFNEEQSNLLAQKGTFDETFMIREFAQVHNMVEAKNISYIFESRDVAQK